MHDVSDRVRTEHRDEKKKKRTAKVEALFIDIDPSESGFVHSDDLDLLAKCMVLSGRESFSVWSEEKLKSAIKGMISDVGDDEVNQATFVEHFERVLPSDDESFDANISMLRKSASRAQAKKRELMEARIQGMDPIQRNTISCSNRTNDATHEVRLTAAAAEQAARDLQKAVAECKAAAVTEARLYTIAADKTQRREIKEVEEEDAKQNLVVAEEEQKVNAYTHIG